MAPSPINEDAIDDLLYFVRTGDNEAVEAALAGIKQTLGFDYHIILRNAIDTESGSSVLHMAAANGHTGSLPRLFRVI